MITMYAPTVAVKPVVRYTFRRNAHNPAFGVGIFPQRGRRLPVGPTDADRAWAAYHLNDDASGVTEDEADRLNTAALTLSPAEYRELVAEVDEAMGRTDWNAPAASYEEEEYDRLAMDALLDRLYADSRDLDRVSFVPAVADPDAERIADAYRAFKAAEEAHEAAIYRSDWRNVSRLGKARTAAYATLREVASAHPGLVVAVDGEAITWDADAADVLTA